MLGKKRCLIEGPAVLSTGLTALAVSEICAKVNSGLWILFRAKIVGGVVHAGRLRLSTSPREILHSGALEIYFWEVNVPKKVIA